MYFEYPPLTLASNASSTTKSIVNISLLNSCFCRGTTGNPLQRIVSKYAVSLGKRASPINNFSSGLISKNLKVVSDGVRRSESCKYETESSISTDSSKTCDAVVSKTDCWSVPVGVSYVGNEFILCKAVAKILIRNRLCFVFCIFTPDEQ